MILELHLGADSFPGQSCPESAWETSCSCGNKGVRVFRAPLLMQQPDHCHRKEASLGVTCAQVSGEPPALPPLTGTQDVFLFPKRLKHRGDDPGCTDESFPPIPWHFVYLGFACPIPLSWYFLHDRSWDCPIKFPNQVIFALGGSQLTNFPLAPSTIGFIR